MASLDELNFNELSRELTMTESAITFLCGQMEEHESQIGHRSSPAASATPAVSRPNIALPSDVETSTMGSDVPVVGQGSGDGMFPDLNQSQHEARPSLILERGFCEEKHRLLNELMQAIHELTALQAEQTQAIITGDTNFSRFDVLLHQAHEKKDNAKYAWMAHVEAHHCENA